MDTRLILGIGSGRCGSTSLSRLLSAQLGVRVVHEGQVDDAPQHPLPWEGDPEQVIAWLGELRGRLEPAVIVGDIGMYYLPYVEHLLQRFPELRVIALKRDRAATVRSFLRWAPRHHHWTEHDGSRWRHLPQWDAAFPKFDESDKAKAIGLYWDSYYAEVERLLERYPDRIVCFPTEALSETTTQRAILEFAGCPEPYRLALAAVHNRSLPAPFQVLREAARDGLELALRQGRRVLPRSIRHWLWNHGVERLHRRLWNRRADGGMP